MGYFMKFASFDIETAAILTGVVNLNEHLEEMVFCLMVNCKWLMVVR